MIAIMMSIVNRTMAIIIAFLVINYTRIALVSMTILTLISNFICITCLPPLFRFLQSSLLLGSSLFTSVALSLLVPMYQRKLQ